MAVWQHATSNKPWQTMAWHGMANTNTGLAARAGDWLGNGLVVRPFRAWLDSEWQ